MSRPLKVVNVIARMNVGGPAVLIANTMRGLDPGDFQTRLITGFCAEDEADYLDTQATDVRAIRVDGLGRSIKPKADLTSVQRLASLLRDLQPDIVHTHTAKAGVVGRAAVTLSGCGARVVHTYHGHLLHGYFSAGKTRAVVAVERLLARGSSRLVTVAPGVRDDLLAARIGLPNQYKVISPGVELGPLPERAQALSLLGLPTDRPIITMMGRITGIKRPDRFADAVGLLQERHPEAYFAVAGSGDLENELRDRVHALPVNMLGWRSDIETVLAASDALVLTSDNEGTPLSLIQAGMAGIPVVATRVGSVDSVVEDGLTGYVVDPDPSAVAEGIGRLLEDPESARAMGSAARSAMAEQYSVEAMVRGHADLYREVMSL